jgi:hypothetical protein
MLCCVIYKPGGMIVTASHRLSTSRYQYPESNDQIAMQRSSERKEEVATGVPGDHPDQQLLLQPTKTQQTVSMFL